MITIISGTGRPGSRTLQVAQHYHQTITQKGARAQLLSLEALTSHTRNADFEQLEAEFLFPATKYFIIVPEYNGTFPGIFKLMIDISDIKKAWWYKKAALTGVSDGRAGNLRGLDHLTNALHYMKMDIMPNKLPISQVSKLMNGNGLITDAPTLQVIDQQIDEFLKF